MQTEMRPLAAERAAHGAVIATGLAAILAGVAIATWVRWAVPGSTYSAARLLPDITLLLILFTAPYIFAKRKPRLTATAAILISLLWVFTYCAQVQFMLNTGFFASRPLIVYSALNLEDVAGVAVSGLDSGFLLRSLASVALVALFARWRKLHLALTASVCSVAMGGLLLVAAAITLAVPASGALTAPLFSSGFAHDLPPVFGPAPRYVPLRLIDEATTRRPNIVIWIVESGRADIIDARKSDAAPPFLNKIARESVSFERTYTSTSHTSKALIGILCGHYPHPQMQIREASHQGFPLTCLPHLLRQIGYKTHFLQAALGAFENRPDLTHNLGFERTTVQEDLSPHFKKAGYFGMDERALLEPLATAASGDGPLFITLLTNLTHHPYAMPGQAAPSEPPANAYGAAVEYVDQFLSEVYAKMGKHLDWNNTVLIVLGDHGEAFGEHGSFQHDSVSYEEVVRVPLFVRFPDRLSPRVDSELRQSTDITPTVLDILGLRWDGGIVGRSLLNVDGHSHVVTTCWPTRTCHSVIFNNRMKVVFHFGNRAEEVYNLSEDPWERADLSRVPGADKLILEAAAHIARARRLAEAPYSVEGRSLP